MNVLVVGGTGFIGRRVLDALHASGWANPVCAARHASARSPLANMVRVDIRDLAGMTDSLRRMDAVVNCVTGARSSISEGARQLVEAASRAGCPRIVHLSSMAVYGATEGTVTEDSPTAPVNGWYGRAKCAAEDHLIGFSRQGGQALILRPGCVAGPGSGLWVGRIGRFLLQRRIGDLGAAGDGWSNLVHVDDVSQAVLAGLRLPVAGDRPAVFNIAAPDSPRWNDYFSDLALAIRATPVRRIGARRLRMDAYLAGPLLKIAERLASRRARWLPDALTPGLLHLWSQEIRLDASAASSELRIAWTPYAETLTASAHWLAGRLANTRNERGEPT